MKMKIHGNNALDGRGGGNQCKCKFLENQIVKYFGQ